MGVGVKNIPLYECQCDICGVTVTVEKDYQKIYNGAQAVRSLGWSYGKDGSVRCVNCRATRIVDRYRFGK